MENSKNFDAYRHHDIGERCQLLTDNRRESGAVVVVPSDEWEAMRQASIASGQAATLSEPGDTETEMPEKTIEPCPGRRLSHFQIIQVRLRGCIATGTIEVQHHGSE